MSTQTEQRPLVERLREGVIWTDGDCPPEDDVVDDVAIDLLPRLKPGDSSIKQR